MQNLERLMPPRPAGEIGDITPLLQRLLGLLMGLLQKSSPVSQEASTASAAPSPTAGTKSPDKVTKSNQASGAPPGYKTISGQVPTGVVAKAKSLLSLPMGSEVAFELDGKRYLARLEQHYHPPGYKGGPNGWHKGCSVYQAAA